MKRRFNLAVGLMLGLLFSCGREFHNVRSGHNAIRDSRDAENRQGELPDPQDGANGDDQDDDLDIAFDLGSEPEDYLSFTEVNETFAGWADKAPHISEFVSYAEVHGFKTSYLRISRAVARPELSLPSVLIAAAVHGDEQIAAATVIGFTHRLLMGYQSDDALRNLIKTRDIYIVPVTCADGYSNVSRTVEGGIDPNRSYPWPGDQNAQSAACVDGLRNLYEQKHFNATIDVHASGRMWLLPWGYTEDRFVEGDRGDLYRQLGAKLASLNNYQWGPIPTMVGYIAPGSSADYFYIRGKELGVNTVALGAEVGTSKEPHPSYIKDEVDLNFEPLKVFISEAPVLFDQSSGTYASYKQKVKVEYPVYSDISPWFVPGME